MQCTHLSVFFLKVHSSVLLRTKGHQGTQIMQRATLFYKEMCKRGTKKGTK